MSNYYRPNEDRPFAYNPSKEDMWGVNLWGEHPLDDDDTCWSGADFATEAEARAYYEAEVIDLSVKWVILQGPWADEATVWEERRNPDYRPSKDDDWGNEFAMQQGMAYGVDAYNEARGCSVEFPG